MEAERNGMVKKIFFNDGVDEKKKRKQVKSKLLTESLNPKSGTTDTIACDTLTITNGPIEFNALKDQAQDYSNEGYRYVISQPYDIPGRERIIVRSRFKRQEVKFLTVSFYNRKSKVMLQRNHKHLMTFLGKHFVMTKSCTGNEENTDQVAKPKQNNKQKHFNKKKETTEGDYISETESDLSS